MKNFISTSLTFTFLHHLSLLVLLFNGYCPMLMVSQGFGKSKELRQVTSSNVVIGPQRKRFGTPVSPSTFSCQGFNTLGVGSIFVLTILNFGRTRDIRPAPIRFFLNFSNMVLHQHLPFSVAVRISLRHILT